MWFNSDREKNMDGEKSPTKKAKQLALNVNVLNDLVINYNDLRNK